MNHKEYIDILFEKKQIKYEMKKIQNKSHRIYMNNINKMSLSCFHDKKYILEDGIKTLAYWNEDVQVSFN